ncbi:MAG: EVE domain-containing protein [Pseudomonadota bacterium]|uniref:EVE domain-containing protein n=1 Tax=Thermithiobacillus tepidarius TaxID=929 RepID=UPI0005707C9B|nr:EVE domain-containing protein [Thermithiobacillus tepidarius]
MAERRYWLMKSEPSEFSIEDLQARPGQTEPWDGVRNYQARNFMRAMQAGDGVLFYHSNCELPGVVGVAEVACTAYPDPTQFDPGDKHFDPRSRPEDPRWSLVEVKFVRRFPRTVSLDALRSTPGLEDNPVVRRGNRLSVLPVSPAEWDIILALGDGG